MSAFTNSPTNTEKNVNSDGKNPSAAAAQVSTEFHKFLADIEDLVKATNFLTGEELSKAKAELNNRIKAAKVSIADAGSSVAERARKTATVTNAYSHDQPWQVIGAGSAIGFLLGYLLARRS